MNNKKFIEDCESRLEKKFKAVDEIAYFNQVKVMEAFREYRVALRHFNGTTGYGYDDEGRDCLGKLYAKVFGTESGIVSPHLLSGTCAHRGAFRASSPRRYGVLHKRYAVRYVERRDIRRRQRLVKGFRD